MRIKRIHLISLSLILVLVLAMVSCSGTVAPPKGDTSKGNTTLTSISVSCSTSTLKVGATLQFVAIGTYADGSTADISDVVSWKSSNTSVGTISGGLVTAVSAGTTDITASLLGVTSPADTITITK